ncbi:cyclodeaminase/cyclohydrolase family protein [Candidatus Saccharibacteria bacterium]|nr:cyclodeaminase/cyclohydrolase family protein [Candidatus Saccharibacteria bacterium]
MKNQSIVDWLDDLGSKEPTPGGGAVAGLNGAIAAAQLKMICEYTKDEEIQSKTNELGLKVLEFLDLATRDSESYLKVREAYKEKNDELIQIALINAAEVSIDTAARCDDLMVFIEENLSKFNKNFFADLIVVIANLKAATRSAKAMEDVNAKSITNEAAKGRVENNSEYCSQMLKRADKLFESIEEVSND